MWPQLLAVQVLRFFVFFFFPNMCHKCHSRYHWTTEASFTIFSDHILKPHSSGRKKNLLGCEGHKSDFSPLLKINIVCRIEGCCKTDIEVPKYYFSVLFLAIEPSINDKNQINSGTSLKYYLEEMLTTNKYWSHGLVAAQHLVLLCVYIYICI